MIRVHYQKLYDNQPSTEVEFIETSELDGFRLCGLLLNKARQIGYVPHLIEIESLNEENINGLLETTQEWIDHLVMYIKTTDREYRI